MMKELILALVLLLALAACAGAEAEPHQEDALQAAPPELEETK